MLTSTDAKGITAAMTYDALNRLLTVSYPDNTQHITYAYDEANSITGCSSAYSDVNRPLIPSQIGHLFRRKSATHSERNRPPG
ncbi:hypothetical protein EO087_00390 [Dyella sp. M7H15-1]|uniref:RHS repeat protein n=1 Tax=Dyella sp. M7H15-1 TaxID=2501295 RepID=UPI00100513B8|nr:RHS repeat protein [Dyella sp. M7H15-1]QAU22622.1 hypothetical protein EO087_00390 [Dyella sp. M7H15-1]